MAIVVGVLQVTAILNSFRWLREHVPGARALHAGCREPYYRCLEMLFPHGVQTSLAHGCQVRLHPRFLGMMPYRYEPEVSGILDSYLHPGMTVVGYWRACGFAYAAFRPTRWR